MAGYTRQSTGSIINGSPITAPPLNSEFNQVAAAFNATTGHGHTGGSGDAPKIPLATSVSGYLPAANGGIGGKNKFDATTTPVATNDSGQGYAPGSMWENTTTGRIYICVGNTTNAAVWRELVQVTSGTAILPVATDTVDLGNNGTRFQDLFLSGGISAATNVAVGGTLNITGATALGSTLGVTGDTTLANLSATGTTVINSIDLNSGAIDSTAIGTTTPAAGTFTTLSANTSLVAATADINGGSIDGATIGANSHTTGKFTTLQSTGQATLNTVDINGGNIDGTVIGSVGTASGSFTTVSTSGQATLATADINGGSIDGATIGAAVPSTGAFTTVAASGGITGALTGNVTGNVTGNLSGGNVTGNVTGNLTGNVTASTGSSTFNNVTIDGTLNMNAGTTATIQNLTAPTNDLDAATKKYVDDEVAGVVAAAPAALDTLNELAAALGDDANFSTTVTNSIATKLPLAGGTMTGEIAMGSNKVTGVTNPTGAQDAATKSYTDTQRDTRVAKTGDTMSGALAMGNNKITGLATPTATTDATNKTYVDGLFGSSTAAAASAAAAATSETNAGTSETNASNSASAALGSQNAAAASLDSFDDRYLGAKSSAPTVDNDGDTLIIGALYFNSTTAIMYVYGSGGWQAAGSSVNGTSDRVTYTATAGQTVFAATYDTGYIDVYLNGVKLAPADFTATNGTSVTLTSGAAVNDIVDLVAYGTFVLADHYTEAQSDARYLGLAGGAMTGAITTNSTFDGRDVAADGATLDGLGTASASAATDFVAVTGDSMTGNLNFGDNDKAIFGAGSDLQIYHDGSNSYVAEGGTGDLILQGAGQLHLKNSDNDEYYVICNDDGAVQIRHDNATKLATTSTGVDITGGLTTTGNVGIGTAAPSSLIHASGAAASGGAVEIRLEDTAASSNSRLMRTGSAYSYAGVGANETWLYHSGAGTINIGPDGAGAVKIVNNGAERMRIEASGFTSFGSFSSSGGSIGVQELAGSKTNVMRRSSTNTTALNYHLNFHNPNGSVGTISTQNSSTIYATSSDYRLKTDAQPMTGASARVQALNPVNFEWIADGTRVDGFLAHEAQTVVPESVTGTRDAMRDEGYEVTPAVLDDDGNETTAAIRGTRSVPDYQGIDQSKLVPLITAALQEALTKIDDLESRLTALEAV